MLASKGDDYIRRIECVSNYRHFRRLRCVDRTLARVFSVMELKDLEADFERMTVAEISAKTEKSERSVRTYLTRHGISCFDYDGAKRKAAATHVVVEATVMTGDQNAISAGKGETAAEAMIANTKVSDKLYIIVSVFYGISWFLLSLWGFGSNGLAFFLPWLLMSFVLFMASMWTWLGLSDWSEKNRLKKMSGEAQADYAAYKKASSAATNEMLARHRVIDRYGMPNVNLVCPHCQTKGQVRSKSVDEITSTKVVPIVGNNIKTRKKVTQMHCDNCDTTWNV